MARGAAGGGADERVYAVVGSSLNGRAAGGTREGGWVAGVECRGGKGADERVHAVVGSSFIGRGAGGTRKGG